MVILYVYWIMNVLIIYNVDGVCSVVMYSRCVMNALQMIQIKTTKFCKHTHTFMETQRLDLKQSFEAELGKTRVFRWTAYLPESDTHKFHHLTTTSEGCAMWRCYLCLIFFILSLRNWRLCDSMCWHQWKHRLHLQPQVHAAAHLQAKGNVHSNSFCWI